jgi:hypothetical protein
LQVIDQNLQTIYKNVQGQGKQLENLKQLLLGSLRIQNTLALIVLEIAQSELATDKETIIKMTQGLIKSGELEQLLAQTDEGKG